MLNEISISDVRNKLLSIPRMLSKVDGPHMVKVTKRGRPVMALVDWEFYESIVETLEIMGDRDLMAALRESIVQLEKGRMVTWPKVKRKLGL